MYYDVYSKHKTFFNKRNVPAALDNIRDFSGRIQEHWS